MSQQEYDDVYLNSRRESIVLLVAFVLWLAWSVGVSYWLGYNQPKEQPMTTVVGIPHWVFWGVAIPWIAANIFTIWFAGRFMADDPLGEELDSDNCEASS